MTLRHPSPGDEIELVSACGTYAVWAPVVWVENVLKFAILPQAMECWLLRQHATVKAGDYTVLEFLAKACGPVLATIWTSLSDEERQSWRGNILINTPMLREWARTEAPKIIADAKAARPPWVDEHWKARGQ